MKLCPKCGVLHAKLGKFCSRACANSRGPRTEEFKIKVRLALKGRKGKTSSSKGKHLVDRITRRCLCCNVEFDTTKSRNRKYCSSECWRASAGGYREGSGRAKTGYYKGIYCGSTYELVWVIYNLDHNVQFTRFPGFVQDGDIKYYPDFLIDNTIIEIKGYEDQEFVNKKTKVAELRGYKVIVLRKEDLRIEFEWVKNNYSYKDLYELYDTYKPKYNLVCQHCNTLFSRNIKPKTDVVFCNRSCAGKGHKGRK